MNRKSYYLFACILVQLVLQCRTDLPPPEILARMEDKVMSSMTLKSLEELVEKDKSVINVKSSLLSKIPEHMLGGRVVIESDGEAFYDSEPLASENVSNARQDKNPLEHNKNEAGDSLERFIVIESAEGGDDAKEEIETPKLTPEESKAVQHFVEVLAEEIATELPKIIKPSRMDFAASENTPSYKPRFDYDSYSKDSLQTKLNGKRYWKDSDHSADPDARSDGKGCTMVVKKFRDPEGHKSSKDGSPVKSVLVTKECVYPDGSGPDARIPIVSSQSRLLPLHGHGEKPKVRVVSYEKQSVPVYSESVRAPEPPIYSSAPESKEYGRDPLKSDYIDKMLEEHFKVFPSFRTTTTAIEELERKLKTDLKDVGNQGKVEEQPEHVYERESPAYSPSYDEGVPNYKSAPVVKTESSPKVYEHHYDYHHNHPKSQGYSDISSYSEPSTYRKHNNDHAHGGHDDNSHQDRNRNYSSDEGRHPTEGTSKPKMLKKSFAYYKKDNPKNDPNNRQYAEEYAQGNYRSFSSDYDSDRDGPEKRT